MKLIRLRESFIPTSDEAHYEIIKPQDLPKILNESSLSNQQIDTQIQRLEEDISRTLTWDKLKEIFPDKGLYTIFMKRLKESTGEKKTYKFPIARYDYLNHNKRIYPRKLWENVIEKQKDAWFRNTGLLNHPLGDDPPDISKSAIVWLGMEIGDNGLVYAYGRFVGLNGLMCEDIIQNFGKLGMSSSGLGEVDEKTYMVNPSTFQIERCADIVFGPSNDVYGDITNEAIEGTDINYASNSGPSKINETVISTPGFVPKQQKPLQSPQQPLQQLLQKPLQIQPKSAILNAKSKIGEKNMTVDATKPNEVAETLKETAATPQGKVAENQTPLSRAMSKVEEKAFRKFVESFMQEASDIKNPVKRLEEMGDILDNFEDGVAPDLREKFEEAIIREREELMKLGETAAFIQEEVGMDVEQFTESAKVIAEQGSLLKENIDDYKLLVEGLTERNRVLAKENKIFETKLALKENRIEKLDQKRNEIRVLSSTKVDELLAETDNLKKIILSQKSDIEKLSEANSKFEKETSSLAAKLVEAEKKVKVREQLLENYKGKTTFSTDEATKLQETNKNLEAQVSRLQERLAKAARDAEAAKVELDSFKTKILEENTPSMHIEPKFEKRINGMLNFREDDGIRIEENWNKLVERYGENILPYEKYIRGAKTLNEANSAFIRYRNYIDPDFADAHNARVFSGTNKSMHNKILEESGMEFSAQRELEDVNKDFMERAKKMGLR
jgi:hypothetical protein